MDGGLDDVTVQYFRDNPGDIDLYMNNIFDAYANDRDLGSLLSRLRIVCQYYGVSHVARTAGLSRKGVQKALSQVGDPQFETLVKIMKVMGYGFTARPKN